MVKLIPSHLRKRSLRFVKMNSLSLCLLTGAVAIVASHPHGRLTKKSLQPFLLPENFVWFAWDIFERNPSLWKPDLIDSWDRSSQDSPVAILLQTMLVYDSNGRPHKPFGINPTLKESVTIAENDHHYFKPSSQWGRRKRNFLQNARLWEQNTVPYEVQSGFSGQMQNAITEAVQIYNDLTCVRFVPRNQASGLPHASYLYLTRGMNNQGCASFVGRQYDGKQDLTLQDPMCSQTRTVVHEFMHAIGQMHEQQRSDRDNYIEILFSNIPSHQHHNFDKTRPTFDRTPYDVESLMQYSLSAFSTNQNSPSMKLKDPRLESIVDSSQTLTFYDVKEITTAYQCNANCQNSPTCQNSGFVAHNCVCMCPPELTGSTCDQVETDAGCGGIINLSAGQQQLIESPNYPSTYNVDKECVWMIRGPSTSNIKLTIEKLDLALNSATSSCYHWLEIRYNLIGQTGIKQCNSLTNQQYTTTNDGEKNIMLLKFDSRFSKDRPAPQNGGFKLKVEALGGSTTTDPCNPNPCQNSGTCTASGSSYTCNCQPGWSGTNCDLASQTCQPNPCQNGGTCYVYGGSYSCQCPPSYGGANCETSGGSLCGSIVCQAGQSCLWNQYCV